MPLLDLLRPDERGAQRALLIGDVRRAAFNRYPGERHGYAVAADLLENGRLCKHARRQDDAERQHENQYSQTTNAAHVTSRSRAAHRLNICNLGNRTRRRPRTATTASCDAGLREDTRTLLACR